MNTALRALLTKTLAVVLALSLCLGMSGCLPLVIYDLVTDERSSSTSSFPPTTEIETEGLYYDLNFEELAAVLFEYEVTWENGILNQIVTNPEAMGIEVPRPATHGDYSFEGNEKDLQFYAEILDALTNSPNIDRDALDSKQAREAQVIEDTLRGALEQEPYFYYNSFLSPSTGAQANLPLSFMDYSFRTLDDVEIYLELLADTPRLFEQLIELEWTKKDLNVLMSSQAMNDTIDEAKAYTGDASTHVLTAAFDEMIDKAIASAQEGSELFALDEALVNEFKARNLEAVKTSIVPAYETLVSELEELLPYCKEDTCLYDYSRGTDYYTLTMKSMGFAESPSSAITTLDTALDNYLYDLMMGSSDFDWENMIPLSAVEAVGSTPEEYIAYVQEHVGAEFAQLEELDYSIKVAPEASPNDYAMAYFLLPPVDSPNTNYIVYFPRNIADEVELFSTMAHEGYPGHMYQIYAYSLEDPLDISKVYGSLAYTEGWAMYAQGIALHCLESDAAGIDAYVAYEKLMYGLYARVDLGVNFEGWSVSDAETYLSDFGLESSAQGIHDVVIKQPVSYLAYGLGVIEFDMLRERAESHLGSNFDPVTYHQFILSLGALPFDMLESEFEAWLTTESAQKV